jgi:hypothetical protein
MISRMTSQVVLYNGYGVALASDSALTVAGQRVYDTAEKVLPLPAPHQLAVLTSGAAMLSDYPYAVLIPEWSRSLGNERLGSAAEYGNSFLHWLRTTSLFSEEQEAVQLQDHVDSLCRRIWQEIQEMIKASNARGDTWTVENSGQYVQSQLESYRDNFECLYSTDDRWHRDLMATAEQSIRELTAFWFDDVPWNDRAGLLLYKTIREYFLRSMWRPGLSTTLAFVGLGAHEMMPSLLKLDIRGVFRSRPVGRVLASDRFDSSEASRYSGYEFLGQAAAIKTFVDGIDEGAYSQTSQIVGSTMTKVRELLRERGVDEQLLEESLERLDQSFRSDWEKGLGVREKRSRFYDVLAGLPVASLVSVARSLIGVESLSQAVNAELNTVGGPIDTAIVTREHGFAWIEHKSKER